MKRKLISSRNAVRNLDSPSARLGLVKNNVYIFSTETLDEYVSFADLSMIKFNTNSSFIKGCIIQRTGGNI